MSVSSHMVLTIHPSPNSFAVLIQHVHPKTGLYLLARQARVKIQFSKCRCVSNRIRIQAVVSSIKSQNASLFVLRTAYPPPIPTQHSCIIHDGFPLQIQNPRLYLIKLRTTKRGKMAQTYIGIYSPTELCTISLYFQTHKAKYNHDDRNFIDMINLQHCFIFLSSSLM